MRALEPRAGGRVTLAGRPGPGLDAAAEELGADLIKVSYPNDPAAFRQIVEACSVPVLVAGGEKGGDEDAIAMVSEAVGAGGAGVCMGRNAFQREDTAAFLGRIVDAVHGAPR